MKNVVSEEIEMTHTEQLSRMQGLDFFIGNANNITFCLSCNGTGEIGDCEGNLKLAKPCDECKCTGRIK